MFCDCFTSHFPFCKSTYNVTILQLYFLWQMHFRPPKYKKQRLKRIFSSPNHTTHPRGTSLKQKTDENSIKFHRGDIWVEFGRNLSEL